MPSASTWRSRATIRDCAALIVDGEMAVGALGLKPWSRAEFNLGPDNAFVPCGYAESLGRILAEAAMSLSLDQDR